MRGEHLEDNCGYAHEIRRSYLSCRHDDVEREQPSTRLLIRINLTNAIVHERSKVEKLKRPRCVAVETEWLAD